MTGRQKENEDKIFKAIRDFKDSVFGLKQSYTPFCYTGSKENGEVFSIPKMREFAEELSRFGRETREYREELYPVLPSYFRMVLMLLAAICSSGDWVFVSMRKLAETALKQSTGDESVLNRIVNSHLTQINRMFPDGEFWVEYEIFDSYMGQVDNEAFFLSVKHALEAFIDEHRLNVLDRDQATENIVARLSRLSAAVERDLARSALHEENER